MDLLDDDLDAINLVLEDDAPSSRHGRIKKGRSGKRKRKSPTKANATSEAEEGTISAPNSAPSSPENAAELAAAVTATAAATAAAASKAMAEDDGDADDELDDYDEIELDDEEAAQRVAYEDVEEEEEEEEVLAEKDEEYDAGDDSDDSENEEVRHRVKKSKGSEDSDDEAKKGDKGKTSRKAPATTKERMLQLRQENQRLRKSVPIDFGERVEEEGAKISIANLLGDLKKKQPQKEEEVVEEDDEEAIEELALLDKVGDIFDTVAAPAEMEEEEEQEAEEEEQEQEEEEQDSEVDAGTAGTNEEEAAALGDSEAAAADAAAAAPTFDPHWLGGELNLRIDDAVRIQGLKGAPQHNGKEARVDSYDANVEGGARYTVRLLIHAAGEDSRLQVRPANLEVLAAAEPAAAETPAAAALSVTDEMKARMEKNRQVALAKREARRLSSSQSASKPADGMAGFFNSGETPAAASLSYDVPMPSPASGGPNAAADPIATELSFEEELAKAVEAAESGPISSGLSFDEEMAKAAEAAESQMATSPAPATQEEQASLPVDDVDEPEAPKDDSVEIDGKPASEETTADAAAEGAEAPAEAEAEEEEEEEEEEEMVDFIAVDEWGGERLGYYFGSGKEGPGYMLDSKVPGDTIPAFQMGVATETLTKWVLSGGDEPSEEKVKVLEPFGWMQVDAEGGFETELTKEQFREIGAAMKAIRASKVEEEEEATQVEDDDDEAEGEEGAEDEAAEAAALEKKKEEEEMEQAELDLDLSLENDKTGQKWSPFKPKPTSRRALRTQMQEQLFIKRAKKKKEMKDAGLIPLDGSMMGPDLEPDQDDEYAPEDEEQREEDNEAAMDAMLNDAEDAVDDVMPVDPEADEKDYQTIDDDTQMDEDDDEPEVELTEEEKLAKEEADAVAAALAEEETKKRLAREAADLKRRAIERRKEQILELRKMALDDRAARKANRALNRGGLMEAEADESGSDFSDDDDEESAERQAIEELRGIDYLAAADSEDENTDTHREMLAKQLGDDMEGFLKQRGDVFDDNGKIIRHGKKMRQMLKAQKVVEEDDMAKKLANASSDEESSSSDDSDDDKSANQFDAAGGSPAQAAAGGAEGDAAAAAGGEGAPARVFAFAAGGVGEAATEPALPTPRDGEAPVLTEKQRRKARKKLQKRMRRAELAASRSAAGVGAVDIKEMEDEVTNMLAPTSSRSQAPVVPGDSPIVPARRPTLRRRNTFTRDSTMDSSASMGASGGGASAFGSIKAGTSKGFFATQNKPAGGGGDPVGHGGSMETGTGGTDLNEKGEAVSAAAVGGFTPFSGASLKRTKSASLHGGGAAAAVRANLRRQQSLKGGNKMGLLDALGGSTLSRAATIG